MVLQCLEFIKSMAIFLVSRDVIATHPWLSAWRNSLYVIIINIYFYNLLWCIAAVCEKLNETNHKRYEITTKLIAQFWMPNGFSYQLLLSSDRVYPLLPISAEEALTEGYWINCIRFRFSSFFEIMETLFTCYVQHSQVSTQFNCVESFQTWMWFKWSNSCFGRKYLERI